MKLFIKIFSFFLILSLASATRGPNEARSKSQRMIERMRNRVINYCLTCFADMRWPSSSYKTNTCVNPSHNRTESELMYATICPEDSKYCVIETGHDNNGILAYLERRCSKKCDAGCFKESNQEICFYCQDLAKEPDEIYENSAIDYPFKRANKSSSSGLSNSILIWSIPLLKIFLIRNLIR